MSIEFTKPTYVIEIHRVKESHPMSASILRWTQEPPTTEGWYWVMMSDVCSPSVVKVREDLFDDGLCVTHTGNDQQFPLSEYKYWLGPLPVPEPPKE